MIKLAGGKPLVLYHPREYIDARSSFARSMAAHVLKVSRRLRPN